MKFLGLPIELKAFGDSGSFEGYASIFGNVDLGGDIIERGAFKEIVKGRDGKIKILNQHRTSDPIGVAEVKQDDKGLYFQGQLILEAPSARSAYALMKGGALDGMSIGYDVLEGGAKVLESGIRQLKALKLWEISPVTFGMNPLAGIDNVKAAGAINTIREFEDFLRDVGGYSKSAAMAIAADGFKAQSIRRDSGDAEDASQYLNFLKSLSMEIQS
jgi:HK97 family phage prohead protease